MCMVSVEWLYLFVIMLFILLHVRTRGMGYGKLVRTVSNLSIPPKKKNQIIIIFNSIIFIISI